MGLDDENEALPPRYSIKEMVSEHRDRHHP